LPDEALVLVAQVYDGFSEPIKNMQRSLRQLTDANQRSHIQGAAVSKIHAESFTKLRESVGKSAEVFRRDFLPAIEKISTEALGLKLVLGGVGAAAAAAVSGASAMAFSFGGTAHRLRDLSRSTGLAFNELRGLESLAPRIGTSVEALDSGFVGLNEHMERLRRNGPAELANMAGASFMPALRNQVAQLANLPRERQFEGILAIGEQIKNQPGRGGGIANEKRFLEFFGLPANFADYSKRQIAEFYANYRRAHRDFTDAEQQAGLAADQAWADLREKMASFSDYVGAHWAPTVTAAMSGVGALFTSLSSGGVSCFSKLRDDVLAGKGVPDAVREIRVALEKDGPLIGAALEKILPDEQQFARGIGLLIRDIARLEKIAHDIPDWARTHLGIHGPGLDIGKPMDAPKPQDRGKWGIHWRGFGWGDDLSKPEPLPAPGAEARPHTTTPSPSIFDRLRGLVVPPAPPTAPAEPPAPFVLPNLGGMDQFKQASPPPVPTNMPKFKSGYSPIAYNQTVGGDNPLKPTSGASSSTSDAINIIAVGTRKGVADGLFDFWNSMKGLSKSGGGIMPAWFETGAGGGSGSAAGGPGGGLGGTSGGGGAGAGGPAAAIGRAVRLHGHGVGGGGGGEGGGSELPPGTGGPLLDEISKSEGTRGYNDAFAHQHPGTDLSKMTIDQVKALAMTQRGSGAIGGTSSCRRRLPDSKKSSAFRATRCSRLRCKNALPEASCSVAVMINGKRVNFLIRPSCTIFRKSGLA
jgi:hypothetical protein